MTDGILFFKSCFFEKICIVNVSKKTIIYLKNNRKGSLF